MQTQSCAPIAMAFYLSFVVCVAFWFDFYLLFRSEGPYGRMLRVSYSRYNVTIEPYNRSLGKEQIKRNQQRNCKHLMSNQRINCKLLLFSVPITALSRDRSDYLSSMALCSTNKRSLCRADFIRLFSLQFLLLQ